MLEKNSSLNGLQQPQLKDHVFPSNSPHEFIIPLVDIKYQVELHDHSPFSNEQKFASKNFKEVTGEKRETDDEFRSKTDLRQRDINQFIEEENRLSKTTLIRNGLFKGPSLEELLKDSRKRMFEIEKLRKEESVLDKYKPIKIQHSKIDHQTDFGGGLADCLELGKRRIDILHHTINNSCTKKTDENGINGREIAAMKGGRNTSIHEDEPLSLLMSKSIKKLSKIELEKANESIRDKYTPRKLFKDSCPKDQISCQDTLEDLLKTSKKKFYQLERESEVQVGQEGKLSCAEANAETQSNIATHGTLV